MPNFVATTTVLELGPFGTWRGLERLAILREEQRLLEREVDNLVLRLAGLGVSWSELGRFLGMSRQGARQRYASQTTATKVVVPPGTSV